MILEPRLTDRLTVGRNATLTLTLTLSQLYGIDMLDELYLRQTTSNAKNEMKMFVIHSAIEIVLLVNSCAPPCVFLCLAYIHASVYQYQIKILWGN
jgi:hypothetical protein